MATPELKNAFPGGHEIYTFGRPFLDHGHHYMYSVCQIVEKKTFKEIHHLYTFQPKIIYA